uniref:C2 domain-containing protein n=2 Tax=Phytophthora ramorum TaxID=164328 RepID=H3GWS7_PHYRM
MATMALAVQQQQQRAEMASYLYEKHLTHQDGVAGTLSIRLVAARNLRAAASMFWVRTCNPYVIFRVGKQSVRSSTIPGNDNPTWRREFLEVKLPKLPLKRQPLGEHSDVRLELIVDAMNEDSLTGKATEAVGMASGSVIGTASVDLTPLVEGKEDVLDQWVPLSGALPMPGAGGATTGKKQQPEADLSLGEVRMVLQYEPHGMEPRVGDVVKFEGFGSYPSAVLGPVEDLELHVKRTSGSYLLCSYTTPSGYDAALRVHRNNVFVVHRGSLFDRFYESCIVEPLEFVGSTPIGQSAKEVLRPYMNVARAFSGPALIATKATLMTTYRASTAAIGAVVASLDEHLAKDVDKVSGALGQCKCLPPLLHIRIGAASALMASSRESLDDFRSPSDTKSYRLLTLGNGLEVVLVQSDAGRSSRVDATSNDDDIARGSLSSTDDTDADSGDEGKEENDQEETNDRAPPQAAACLAVNVGSLADPEALPGLAHYLEHMVFMGSNKYPTEDAFEAFLSAHGGSSNGATECESTRFVFDVDAGYLEPALEMFASLFLAPLLRREAMDRELKAVESEFQRVRNNNPVRVQQVMCETSVQGHPYSRCFTWGNVESLKYSPERDGVDVPVTTTKHQSMSSYRSRTDVEQASDQAFYASFL